MRFVFIHSLLVSIFALTHAVASFFSLPKQCLAFIPIGGSSSVSTNTGAATVICWFVASFYSVCLPDWSHQGSITGPEPEPRAHQDCENAYPDRLLVFFPFGEGDDDEYIWNCPKIFIPQLKSRASRLQVLVMRILCHPPLCNLHLTFISPLSGHSLLILFFFLLLLFSSLSVQLYFCSFICSLLFALSRVSAISTPRSSRVIQASSAAQPQFCCHLSTFLSLSISFLIFCSPPSVCAPALSLLCQLISLFYSIKIRF